MHSFPSGSTFVTDADGLTDLYRQLPRAEVTILRVAGGVEDWPCAVGGLIAAASSVGTVAVTDRNAPARVDAFADASGARLVSTATESLGEIVRSSRVGREAVRALTQLLMPFASLGDDSGVARSRLASQPARGDVALQLVDGIAGCESASGSCDAGVAGDTPDRCPRLSTAAAIASVLRDYAAGAPHAPTVVVVAAGDVFGPKRCERHQVYGDFLSRSVKDVALWDSATTQDERRGFAVTRAFRESLTQDWRSLPRHRIATLDRDTFDFAAYLATGDDHYLSLTD